MREGIAAYFDLDGTLVETLPDVTAAVNHTLEGAGKPPLDPSAVRGMIGDGVPSLAMRPRTRSWIHTVLRAHPASTNPQARRRRATAAA